MDAPGQLPMGGEKAVLWPGRVREADGAQQMCPGLEHEAAAGSPVQQAHGALRRPGRPSGSRTSTETSACRVPATATLAETRAKCEAGGTAP